MTIDERLRQRQLQHEAWARSAELLRIAQQETDKRFTRVAELFAQTRQVIAKLHVARPDASDEGVNPSDCAGT